MGPQIPFPSLLGNLWNPLRASPRSLSHPPSLSDNTHSPAIPQPPPLTAQESLSLCRQRQRPGRISDAREVPTASCQAKNSQLLQHTPTSPSLLDRRVCRGREKGQHGGRMGPGRIWVWWRDVSGRGGQPQSTSRFCLPGGRWCGPLALQEWPRGSLWKGGSVGVVMP